ncbi:MerR family DNA-binding transcriptional regulator [Frankia sp. RB7]|nr:MerR family DNA-binding transcriptional regulator [Frankia sp. RB7]
MLRYYEGEGLLAPQRTDAGYRDYGPEEEQTVRQIKMLGAAAPCNELRRILAQQVGLIDERIETLSQSRTILAGYLASVN